MPLTRVTNIDEAVAWLREYLTQTGPVLSGEAKDDAAVAGVSERTDRKSVV